MLFLIKFVYFNIAYSNHAIYADNLVSDVYIESE